MEQHYWKHLAEEEDMVGMNLLLAEVSFAMDKILTLIWIVPSEWELQLLPVLVFLEFIVQSKSTSFHPFRSYEVFVPPPEDVQFQLGTLKHTETY